MIALEGIPAEDGALQLQKQDHSSQETSTHTNISRVELFCSIKHILFKLASASLFECPIRPENMGVLDAKRDLKEGSSF